LIIPKTILKKKLSENGKTLKTEYCFHAVVKNLETNCDNSSNDEAVLLRFK